MDSTPEQISIIERIARDVLQSLEGVNRANGCTYTLSVRRATRGIPKPAHLRADIYQDDPERNEVAANGKEEWLQPFWVNVYIMPGRADATPVDQYLNFIWADMVKALMADPTRGGLAKDTFIRAPRYITDNDEYDGFEFHFAVMYRTVLGDPRLPAA